MEGEIIIVAVISSISGLFGVWLINQNWFKRQEFKYKYLLKRQRLSAKGKIPSQSIPEPKSALGTLTDLLPLLKNLDADQLGALVDKFTGEPEFEEESGGGGVTDAIMAYATEHPEVVKGLLGEFSKGKPPEQQVY